jgi:hypothetical protein
VLEVDRERAARGRPQPYRVEVLAHAEVTGLVIEAECPRAGPGGQVQQVDRRQVQAVRTQHLLDEVGLQRLLGQEQARSRADVGAERDADAVPDVSAQRE